MTTAQLLHRVGPHPTPSAPSTGASRSPRPTLSPGPAPEASIPSLPAAIRRTAMDLFQLAARIEAEGPRPIAAPEADGGRCVPLVIDAEGFRVWVADEPLSLTYREFRLLQELVGHAGRAISRQELLHRAWDRTTGDARRTVDVHVRRLRVALGPAASRVTTVRNVGYRFD